MSSLLSLAFFEAWLIDYAKAVPLELFTLIGTFIEEVVAPIPSPLVLTLAGSIAQFKLLPLWYIGLLAIIGSVGKTLGAILFYVIADKAEDVVITRVGKFVGITHKEIESIGAKFQGGRRDYVTLFVLRALPIMPSSPISLMCGILKVNVRTFISMTFVGTIIRNLVYISFGYAGASTFESTIHGMEKAESVVSVILFGAVGLLIFWIYLQRRKGGLPPWLAKLIGKK